MKKFLFSLLTVAISISFTSAQQMSYYIDMVGSPGQSLILAKDTSPFITDFVLDMSDTGAARVWSFEGLDSDELDTLNFMNLNAQESIDFPGANIVMESNIGRIVFNKDASTGLYLLGTSLVFAGFPLGLGYNPGQRTIPGVCSLHTVDSTSSVVDEIFYTGIDTNIFGCQITIDSIRLKRTSYYHVHFDATGELRLPLDTFDYTLRAVSFEVTVDSVFNYCPNGINPISCFGMSAPIGWSLMSDQLIAMSGFADSAVVHKTTHAASWYNPYTISPICVVDLTYDPGYTDTNFVSVTFKGNNTPDIGLETVDQILLNVYPNPASNLLILQTNADISKSTLYIWNAQGQQVKTVNMNGSNMIDVSGLTNGMYFYQLADGKKLLHNGKFIIKR